MIHALRRSQRWFGKKLTHASENCVACFVTNCVCYKKEETFGIVLQLDARFSTQHETFVWTLVDFADNSCPVSLVYSCQLEKQYI